VIIGPGFIICSPTKTGMRSLQALAASTDGEMYYVKENHQMDVPTRYKDLDRIMTLRNPYTRLISAYHFMQRKQTEMWHRQANEMDFPFFVKWFLDRREELVESSKVNSRRAPGVWIYTLSDCWRIFRGEEKADVYAFRQEHDFQALFDKITTEYGVRTSRDAMPHVNKNMDKEVDDQYDVKVYYPKAIRRRVWEEWSGEDCERFGYRRVL
jgi:hypothetical protein